MVSDQIYQNWQQIVTQIIGTIVVVALVNWYLVIPSIVVILLILQIRWIYIKTGRDLKRFENMGNSQKILLNINKLDLNKKLIVE